MWGTAKFTIGSLIEKRGSALLATLNDAIGIYNVANPDAHVQPYALTGGTVKSRAGGEGMRRNYNRLAELLIMYRALWNDKPQVIDFDSRNLSYPVMIENNQTVVQYTGLTYATYTNTRAKDKTKIIEKSLLVNGKTYQIGMLNTLNTQANGNALDKDGKPFPVAGPNTWGMCNLPGITITDMSNVAISNPTLAQFYDRYIDTLSTPDTDDQDEPQAPTE